MPSHRTLVLVLGGMAFGAWGGGAADPPRHCRGVTTSLPPRIAAARVR